MLSKVLWILLALVAGWWLWKVFVRLRAGAQPSESPGGAAQAPPGADSRDARSTSEPSQSGHAAQGSPKAGDPPQDDASRPAEALVACAHCGAWSGRAEALLRDGLWYCDEAHARAGPK